MKKHLLAAVAALALCGSAKADAWSEFYHARAFMTGFLARASKVCETDAQGFDTKAMMATSLKAWASITEFYQSNRAQFNTWAKEGAGKFNEGAAEFTTPAACGHATQTAAELRDKIAADKHGQP